MHGDRATFTRHLLGLLEDVKQLLPRLTQVAMDAASDEVEVGGASAAVMARSRNGVLVLVDCDPAWLARTQTRRIEQELTSVLTRAVTGSHGRVSTAVRGTGRVGELLDLAGDPARLLFQLGLTR